MYAYVYANAHSFKDASVEDKLIMRASSAPNVGDGSKHLLHIYILREANSYFSIYGDHESNRLDLST